MKACATAGGGVMFIPEELERKGAVSYSDLIGEEKVAKKVKPFGKKPAAQKPAQQAA